MNFIIYLILSILLFFIIFIFILSLIFYKKLKIFDELIIKFVEVNQVFYQTQQTIVNNYIESTKQLQIEIFKLKNINEEAQKILSRQNKTQKNY